MPTFSDTAKPNSRRSFLKFCTAMASMLTLPAASTALFAEKLRKAQKPSVIWLSFQECTGCTESFTRAHSPTLEGLIFDHISLDYHHTLQAASGMAAEEARRQAMLQHKNKYLLIVDGSVPTGQMAACSTIAGSSNMSMLRECVASAAAVMAIGSCASFGGLPAAKPNPTAAMGIAEMMRQKLIAVKPLINLPGCPPVPAVISAVLAHMIAFARFPELDAQQRPVSFYGNTVHERCSRYHFFQQGKFATSFDDKGARKGWCLYELGCKGPVTHNACSVHKWNEGVSSPIDAGHPCLGCSEPGFWDQGGFYRSLAQRSTQAVATEDAFADAVSAGKTLYEDNCVYCHQADPGQFRVSANEIRKLFQQQSIRAHRAFNFDVEELDALESYINAVKNKPGAQP